VFVKRDAQWEWVGEGSVRSRDASVRVLALDAGHCKAIEGTCTPLGGVPDLQRVLYEINGTTEWRHPDLGTCQIRCASQDASEGSFMLHGSRLPSVLNPHPPFLGMPNLYAIGRDDVPRRIVGATLEWRPMDAPESAWRTDVAACAGTVWLRYRDTSGALRFHRRAEVLPATTWIEMVRVGASVREAGGIRLTGLPAVRVTVPEVTGCHFQQQLVERGVIIGCFAQAGLPITQFGADLHWPDGRSLRLMLPFPRQGAAFVRAGQVLPLGERVPLGRLAAIQAVIYTPTGGSWLSLEGRVRTRTSTSRYQELREVLPTASGEPAYFALHRVQERLATMLALTGDLDAVVILEVVDWQGHALARLEVAQFDMELEPDRTHSQVVLSQSSLGRLNDGWQERLTVKMLPLCAPATEPTNLPRDQMASAWQIPDGLEPGPWWVLGMDGDWARFRPLLWVVPGEKPLAEESELMQAIHEPVRATRQAKLQALVRALAAQAEHPDWPHVFDHLRLIRTYPASALDIVQHLAHVPEAMILALLRSADEEFDLVWSLAEQLPFSWHLVPVAAWLRAAERHFDALRVGLGDYDPGGNILWGTFWEFRQRVTCRQPFFQSVCDWIGERLFLGRQMTNNVLAMARRAQSILTEKIQEYEQELQERHDADALCLDGPLVMERTRSPDFPEQFRYARLSYPYRPVRCAPFIAAQISLHSQAISEEFLFELRQLRDFDPEWFDNAFALALCRGLAEFRDS
jgi:hypothetical protein